MILMNTVIDPKKWSTLNHLHIKITRFYIDVSEIGEELANSADPDQTAPNGAV